MSRLGAGLLLLALGCGGPPAPPPPPSTALDVHVEPAADLQTLAVRICADPLPPRLMPGVPAAQAWTHDFHVVDGPPLEVHEGRVAVPPQTRCVAYTVDLRAAAERATADVISVSPGRWMWRPTRLPAVDALRARLTATPGAAQLSLPWPRLPAVDGQPAWRIPWNGFRYRCNGLIGRFERAELAVAGAVLDVAFVGRPQGDRARFEAWLTAAAADVATVFGEFPVPRAQVIVSFEPGAGVGFGATARGGGPGVVLFVGADTGAHALADDWTATHELFHLGMPLIAREDAWLSEGVTTVYTYLAMARSGRLTPAELRAELRGGFRRGALTATGRSLAVDSRQMAQTGAWWRVYWGGGAWALERALAMAASGRRFDEVLRLWRQAALDPGPARSAMTLLDWADRALPGFHFAETARRALKERDFPTTDALLDALDEPATRATLLAPYPADQPTIKPTSAAAE